MSAHEWMRSLGTSGLAKENGYGPALAVATACWKYASPDGSGVYPGVQRLSEDTGLRGTSVRKGLKWLETRGWLTKVKDAKRGQAAEYRLSIPSDDKGNDRRNPTPRGITSARYRDDAEAHDLHIYQESDDAVRLGLIEQSQRLPELSGEGYEAFSTAATAERRRQAREASGCTEERPRSKYASGWQH